tara:strand:+ start:4044 stop:4211 length:168 start_codon:yes stop_codon:yes gene_type:complete
MPAYTGMDRNRVNKELRDKLTVIRIGRQGIAFDINDVDKVIDDFILKNGRPPKIT